MSDRIYTVQEIMDAVRPLLLAYNAEKALLFGSYARQEATSESDIDLVIIGGSEFEPTDVFCIAEELYELLQKKVDVFELREINEGTEFYNNVFEEGVLIA